MTSIRALLLMLFIVTACFMVALPALWMDLFSTWVGILVLIGILVFGGLLGLFAAKRLIGNRRTEAAARLQQWQGVITWACAVATVGTCLSAFANGAVAVIGLVITSVCGCVAWWALLRAVPAKTNGNMPDGGNYQI